ncbi:MAG: ferric reductase-like transmembrane domain-containing protein [Chloroflexi bacterium]|nr:ferric reductase-like transmembrane domain-containing protein [Chloroflexota bacterium]
MKLKTLFLASSGFLASLLGGLTLSSSSPQEAWLVSRASGLVAFVLLSASVILGLLMSTKLGKRLLSGKLNYELHAFLSVLTLSFLGLHAGALLFDGFFTFTPLSLLVPFLSPYQPLTVGLGVIAAWSTAAVAASFWYRKQLGHARWRKLHYLSFGAYVLALVHGYTVGTDSSLPFVQAIYLGSALAVSGLLAQRIFGRKPQRQIPRPAAGRVIAGI